MGATVYFANAAGNDLATLGMTFEVSGTPTDPTAVSCVITDPAGNATVHTYLGAVPADITKSGTGAYVLDIGSTLAGLWAFVWIGTGPSSDVEAGTWTVQPSSRGQFYTSVEEMKSRLGITDTASDFELLGAIQAATRAIEGACGRHFCPITEVRTYVPWDLYMLPVDDIVSVTSVKIDRDGDGTFEESWTQGTDYELSFEPNVYNQNVSGEARPYTIMRVINGGGRFFPFVWPFSRQDRVQISATFGWPEVPFGVSEATRQTSAEIFKLKDSPFGLMGTSEFGLVRVPRQNSYIMKLLNPYLNVRRAVGV
jgi:hypothetical protein